MKVGEIWQNKDINKEKVVLNYIEYMEDVKEWTLDGDGYYVGYTYLENPKDSETPKTEHMVTREFFVDNFEKVRDAN